MIKKKILLLVLQILLLMLITMPSGLTSTSSYYLDSSRLELQVSPTTDTASGMVRVSSNSNHPVRLKVIPKLWHLNPEGVLVYDEPPKTGYNLLDNIGINPEEFELSPGKSQLVRFIIKVPHEVSTLESAFQLYFQPASLLESETKKSTPGINHLLDVVPVFTTTVYVYKGNPIPAPQIDQFKCGYLPDKNQVSVNLDLNNTGTKQARLLGNIILSKKESSGQNKLLEVLHVQNSTLMIVFPNRPRLVKNNIDLEKTNKLSPGAYQMELRLIDERNIQPAIQSTCDFLIPGD